MFALNQPVLGEVESLDLAAPFAHLWDIAMSDDLVAAAYALHYFHPFHRDFEALDENNTVPLAAYHCLHAGFIKPYAHFTHAVREGSDWADADAVLTNAVNSYLPEPVIDSEILSFGHLPIPWMGFDWYDDSEGTYRDFDPGYKLLCDLIGIPDHLGATRYDPIEPVYNFARQVADDLHAVGHSAVAAAVRWLVGATTADLLNYSWSQAADSGMEWPHIDHAAAWIEESLLCEQYAKYADAGVEAMLNNDHFQACLEYNILLRKYQSLWEENCERFDDHVSIREGFVWPACNSANAPQTPDDFDLLSFWHR